MKTKKPQWEKIKQLTNRQEIEESYEQAEYSMSTLNRNAARLMKQYKVNACTDVTGFGILGHAKYLA